MIKRLLQLVFSVWCVGVMIGLFASESVAVLYIAGIPIALGFVFWILTGNHPLEYLE